MPTYPFERQRYWVETTTSAFDPGFSRRLVGKKPDIADWFYVPSWKRSTPPRSSQLHDPANAKGCWLIFAESCGCGSHVASRLIAQGQNAVTVTAGKQFARLDDRAYVIDPSCRRDYGALLKELRAQGATPKKIVHLWCLTPSDQAPPTIERAKEFHELGFNSLLFLAQALGDEHQWDCLEIVVVTSNLQEVNGDEALNPEKATVLGPCKCIPQEYQNISCRCVDFAVPASRVRQEDVLVDQLMAELGAMPSDAVVAYRGRHRWVQTFEPVRWGEKSNETSRLREGGVYLITGGLGGLGLILAEYLAQTSKAKLILTGRTPFPKKNEWETWLSDSINGDMKDDEKQIIRNKIRKLKSLEELGAEVQVVSADVANMEEMRALVAEAHERFGAIHGVIHAAGILNDGIIQLKEPEIAASVLSPKVQGTLVLDALFKDTRLDFFILFSSLRSIVGGRGIVDYCAANAFLDMYAHRNVSRNGTFTVSVNWDAWQEAGMSVSEAAGLRAQRNRTPEALALGEGLSPKEGLEVFCRILDGASPQVIVSTQDFQAVVQQYDPVRTPALEATEKTFPAQASHPRPDVSTPYVAPGNETERILATIWEELLGIERVSVHDNFFELGGDSVMGLQFVARAHQKGIRFTASQVFEHQTIAELAAVNTGRIGQAEQGMITGIVPLTPIQHWFFEQKLPDPHHSNMGMLLKIREPLNFSLLEKSVRQLILHHDALRLRFIQDESAWQQSHSSADEVVAVSRVDLSTLPEIEQGDAMQAAAAQLQGSLNLSEGPLLRVALFDLGARQSPRLLILCHHLVIDIASWRILLEDLQMVYQQLSRGQAAQLPLKTHSFKEWAEHITKHTRSDALQRELDYWLAPQRSEIARLPVDYPRGSNTVASERTVSVSLTAEETQILLRQVPRISNAQVREVLLTALMLGFRGWTGGQSLAIDLEEDGRDVIFEGIDVSRTVGWFTTVFPMLLNLKESSTVREALNAVKDQIRQVPKHGMGYGLLRYLTGDKDVAERLRLLPPAEVSFLYAGRFDQSLPKSSLFQFAQESLGPARSLRGGRRHLFEVIANVAGTSGSLQLQWTFSENLHRRSTVTHLAERVASELRSLIAAVQTSATNKYSATDFPGAGLSQEELDSFIASISQSD
jgi:non-ribosomal peptide synthase protein (TIGR01720 family)